MWDLNKRDNICIISVVGGEELNGATEYLKKKWLKTYRIW